MGKTRPPEVLHIDQVRQKPEFGINFELLTMRPDISFAFPGPSGSNVPASKQEPDSPHEADKEWAFGINPEVSVKITNYRDCIAYLPSYHFWGLRPEQ